MAIYNERHEEVPDPTPLALPVGYKKPETLQETMARMIRNQEYVKYLNGAETFEEADDFDCGPDDNPLSPYEAMMVDMVPETVNTEPTSSEAAPDGEAPVTATGEEAVENPREIASELPKKEAKPPKS